MGVASQFFMRQHRRDYIMKRALTTTIATVALAASFTAMSADRETVLGTVQLPVMVNQGGSYVEAQESMFLYPGDQVMVMNGGSAQVHYANGCVQTLGTNEISRVGTADSCNTAAAAGTHNQVGSTPAAKPTGFGGGETPPVVGWTGNEIAAVAIAGGMTAFIGYKAADGNSNGGGQPPISP
jgi:hypothetical protein